MVNEDYITPIGKRARLIRELVTQAHDEDTWEGIDAILDKIDNIADQLTAW